MMVLSSPLSYAQERDFTSYLSLYDEQDIYHIGGHIYVTRDPGKSLNFDSYQRFMDRHMAGNLGSAVESDILNLGFEDIPHWIVLAVNNQSWTEKWVLNFGNHMDGRIGLIKDLFIYDHNAKKTYLNTLKSSNNPYVKTEKLNGHALTLDLPRGKKTLIFLYVVPKPGLPLTLAPRLMTESAYNQEMTSPIRPGFVISIFFMAMVGFFLATILFRQMWNGIIFILYYAVLLALFHYHNDTLQNDFDMASRIPGIFLNASILLGLLITKNFLGIGKMQRFQGRLLAGFMLGIFAAVSLAVFVIPVGQGVQLLIMYGPALLATLFLAMLSAAFGYNQQPEAYQVAAGWFAVFIGLGMAMASVSNLFSPDLLLINGYWYGLVIQGILFITAVTTRIAFEDQTKRQIMKEKHAEQESIADIVASKEASENARLLRMIEHERQVMNELREREVEQNEEMKKAKEEADLANNAKSAFLAVVSHEIRTPMTGIMGMVRFLQGTKLSAEQKKYAQTIQDSGEAMMSLLNDILDFEKIGSDKMDLEHIDFDLHRLIQGVKTLMSGHAEAKNIFLKVDMDEDVPRYVIGDPVRLRQVILNLTGNSIKFTDEGGVTVHVKLDKANEKSGAKGMQRIRFSIEDTGVGISKEAQKNLFNPFTQADSAVARKFGGTGLGLAISQKLIEAMGGKIEIDSTEGHGSTFFFTLSMEEGSAEAVEIEAVTGSLQETQKPEKVMKVLIVEDNEINQKLMKELVDRMGHETTLAGSGEEAVEKIKEKEFDMVLMDIELPGMTGMGTTKAIRALEDPHKAALPVIAMTGNVRDEDVRQCYAANMNGHLAKPVDPKRLKEQIGKVIRDKLDNPVEISDDKRDYHTPVTKLDIGGHALVSENKKDKKMTKDMSKQGEIAIHNRKTDEAGAKEKKPAGTGFGGDDDIAPIRALALEAEESGNENKLEISDDELDEDTFETAMLMNGEDEVSGEIFNQDILENLRSSVGAERLDSLIDEMMLKADDLLLQISNASDQDDIQTIASRAHELKGMAGNFGLIEVKSLAAAAEAAAKENQGAELKNMLVDLSAARDRAKVALETWAMSENS